MSVAPPAPARGVQANGGTPAAGEGIEKLLQEVRTEPREDEEIVAKFSIYEGYSTQLEAIRKLLFEFHAESAPTMPAALQGDWRRQLKGVDSAEAMSVPDDGGRIWFVYHMLKAAERNNRKMTMCSRTSGTRSTCWRRTTRRSA